MSGAALRVLGLALILLLWAPTALAATGLRVEGFSANLPGPVLDDAVWIRNMDETDAPLDGVVLEDGTGRLAFPPEAVARAGVTIVIAGNASAYRAAAGADADFAVQGLEPGRTMRPETADFALARDGDVIRLAHDGTVLDVVRYGDAPPAEGWSGPAFAVGGSGELRWYPRIAPVDHDDAADFGGPREFRLGQLATRPFATAFNGTVLPFVAPATSRLAVEAAISLATARLRVNVYQFRDLALADFLAARIRDARLQVEVLLDDRPVGESAEELSERGHVMDTLRAAGATVRLLRHDRYGYDHAKFIVVDTEAVLVQTENFVASGIPLDGATGNRGWGVLLQSPPLAQELARIFDADFALDPYGAREPSAADAPTFPRPLVDATHRGGGSLASRRASGEATLLAAPDGPLGPDDPVLAAIRGATTSIQVVQLNLPTSWTDPGGASRPNPYFQALGDAADRGVEVRLLLDGHFVDEGDGRPDNQDTVRAVAARGLPNFAARLVGSSHPVLHAKGLVVDGTTTLVGSMNWNRFSVQQNREVSLVLKEPGTAAMFQQTFEADWAALEPDLIAAPGLVATVLTVVLVLALRPAWSRP